MHIVVIGGGLAGANAVTELRAQGFADDITLIGAEHHPPYERPPLSKGLLLGSAEADSALVHPIDWYARHQVDFLAGHRVHAIDLEAAHVFLADRTLAYDRLLIATGAQPRRLPAVDGSGADVRYLRTLDDSLALKPELSRHLLIVGAGWIGLEVAAAAREAGGRVTVVEPAAIPLAKVLGPELAPILADLHREHGVDLRLRTSLESVQVADGRTTARLSDGTEVTPDLVLVGIGAVPDDELAHASGLAADQGILVDARLRTSDPRVFAAGDVARHDHPMHGRIRVEHWDTAIQHGRHAARAMLGDDTPYDRQPYFFTDQYDLGMEYVGHVGPEGYDEVIVRGDRASRVVNAFWLKGNRVLAGMHLNDWDAIDAIKGWVGREAGEALRDTSVPLPDPD